MTWQLLKERSPRGEFARRRLIVLTAAGLFMFGLLVAVGLTLLAIFIVVAALVAGAIAAVATKADRPALNAPDLSGVGRGARTAGRALHVFGSRVARDARPAVAAARRQARDLQPVVSGFVERAATRVKAVEINGWPYAGATEPATEEPAELHKQAIQLNARGAQLRSEGHPEEAAEQHRRALAIFRNLGDRRAEAPTLNSLALALDASGDSEAAVERFEQALTILRDLHDDRHEGKVIANLGFTMLRQGDDDRARGLLETALEKLDPESRAAQQVVEQLRHAS